MKMCSSNSIRTLITGVMCDDGVKRAARVIKAGHWYAIKRKVNGHMTEIYGQLQDDGQHGFRFIAFTDVEVDAMRREVSGGV